MTPVQTLFRGQEALVPGTLRGYRTWRLTLGGHLVSTAMESLWDDGVNEATCFSPLEHPGVAVPDARCQCGFYGWYAPDDSRIVPSDVFGVIEASGRIILGTHGFRAERARPVAVVAMRGWVTRDALVQLHARGVEVYFSRTTLLRAYPPDDVSGLVEHTCSPGCLAAYWAPVPAPAATPAPVPPAGDDTCRDGAPARGARHARPPARWQRLSVVALCALGAVVTAVGIVNSVIGAVTSDDAPRTVLFAGAAGVCAVGTDQWRRHLRRAWRWGR
jgi:hypothetical protein